MEDMACCVAGNYQVLAFRGLNNVDGVGQAYPLFGTVKQSPVAQFEILPFPNCLVHWAAFDHERDLLAHIESYDVVVLQSKSCLRRIPCKLNGRSDHFWAL